MSSTTLRRRHDKGNSGVDNPLQRYIKQRMDQLGITSWAELGRRSGLSRATVHTVATQPRLGMPRRETIDGLAKGLQVTPAQLRAKAFETAGLPYTEREVEIDAERTTLMASIESLTDDDVREILAIVEAKQRNRGQQERSPQ